MKCSLRGMSAVKTASSSPLRILALVSISSGWVSEKGDTRNAADESDRSVISPSAYVCGEAGQGMEGWGGWGSPTLRGRMHSRSISFDYLGVLLVDLGWRDEELHDVHDGSKDEEEQR